MSVSITSHAASPHEPHRPRHSIELAEARDVGFPLKRALFALVAHRMLASASKLHCHERWLAEEVRIEGCDALELHHLYRVMDRLGEEKEEIEKAVYFRLADLFEVDVDLIFIRYDVGALRDRRPGSGGRGSGPQAGFFEERARGCRAGGGGSGGDTRRLPRASLGVLREHGGREHGGGGQGGSTGLEADPVCVRGGCRDGLEAEPPEALAWGGRYIVCVPVQPGEKIDRRILSSRGRYREMGPNLRVKEVVLGEGERRERYAVCHNP